MQPDEAAEELPAVFPKISRLREVRRADNCNLQRALDAPYMPPVMQFEHKRSAEKKPAPAPNIAIEPVESPEKELDEAKRVLSVSNVEAAKKDSQI